MHASGVMCPPFPINKAGWDSALLTLIRTLLSKEWTSFAEVNDQTSQKPAGRVKETPDAVFVAHSGCFVGLVTHNGIRGQEWLSRFMHALRGEIKNKYRQPTTTRASGQTEQLNHDFPLNTVCNCCLFTDFSTFLFCLQGFFFKL